MDVQCGMCGDTVTVRYEASESDEMPSGIICVPCQDYTMGYIYPVPVMEDGGK